MIVDDDARNTFALTALLHGHQLEVIPAESGEDALAILGQGPGVDIVLVDIMMPGMDGYQTLRAMRKMLGETKLPLVAFTAKVGVGERQRCLNAGASDYIPKPVDTTDLISTLGKWIPAATSNGAATGPVHPAQPAPQHNAAQHPQAVEEPGPNGRSGAGEPSLQPLTPPANPAVSDFAGRKVLIVDDDFANIFALTALLERSSREVVSAESGGDALAIIDRSRDIDLVLVDIVMPVMDGYQTLRSMRKMLGAAAVPLIAVTAKIEAGERERCLDSGASDYAPKPVNTADLITILGKWIPAAAQATADQSP